MTSLAVSSVLGYSRDGIREDRDARRKEKQKATGWLEPAGEWADHNAVQRQESHVPHYLVPRLLRNTCTIHNTINAS